MSASSIKVVIIVVCMIAAATIYFFTRSGDKGSGPDRLAYFYDQSEKQLFTAPASSVAPIKGINDDVEDGVRAIVYAGPDGEQKIAYLETYTLELKKRMIAIESMPPDSTRPGPSVGRDFMSRNTLVRLVDGKKWYPLGSARGEKIVAQWEEQPGGRPEILHP